MTAADGVLQKNPSTYFSPEADPSNEETQGPSQFHIDGAIRGLCQLHLSKIGRADPAAARAIQGRLHARLFQAEVARQRTESENFRSELMEEFVPPPGEDTGTGKTIVSAQWIEEHFGHLCDIPRAAPFCRGARETESLLRQKAAQLLTNAIVDSAVRLEPDARPVAVKRNLLKILPPSTSTIGWKGTSKKVPIRDITDLVGHKTVLFEDFFRSKKDTFNICEVKTPGSPCQQITLPKEVKRNIATFINEHGSCKKCCCLDFVKAANGLPYEPAVWHASQWTHHRFEGENQLLPGSTVALRHHKDINLNDPAAHYAIYLTDGLYLSKFGNGGPIVVTSLEAMHKFYHTDLEHVLTANKY